MKKLKFILPIIGMLLIVGSVVAVNKIQENQEKECYEYVIHEENQVAEIAIQPTEIQVLNQASVFDSFWNFIKGLDWVGVISLLLAGGFMSIVASVKKVKKEINDVILAFKLAKEDGKITQEESEELIQELTEAIQESTKLWYMIVGIFKPKPKDK